MEITTFEGKNGLLLAAEVTGPPSGVTAVLLHGGGQTRFSWRDTASELANLGYRVICADLRGHGDSEWSAEGYYDLDDYVADLKHIMCAQSTPCVLVGASLGGVISLIGQGEGLLPTARAMVLVDVVPRMEAGGVREVIDFMTAHSQGFASVEAAADAVAEYLPHRRQRSSNEGLLKNLRKGIDGRYFWHWDPAISASAGSAEAIEEMATRMEKAATRIDIPTLAIRGGQSRVVSEAGVAHLVKLIPHAEYTDVAAAGHMVAGDRNDDFNSAICEFLARFANASEAVND